MDKSYQENTRLTIRSYLLCSIVLFLFLMSIYYLAQSEINISYINYNSHSIEKHGNEAVIVRSCLDKNGGINMFFNPKTNRFAEVCFLDNGKYGIQITEEENEITSFIKNKMLTLKQVVRYLKNVGYINQVY